MVDNERFAYRRVFAEMKPGAGGGFLVDTAGDLFTNAADGTNVYRPVGELLGNILIPEHRTASCVFGGPDKLSVGWCQRRW